MTDTGLKGLVSEWREQQEVGPIYADEAQPFLERLEAVVIEEPHGEDCYKILHQTHDKCDCWKAKLRSILHGDKERKP